MKTPLSLFSIAAASILVVHNSIAGGGTFTLDTSFDATFDNSLSAPFKGTASLSYTAPSQLPDGVYSWQSFSGLTLAINFPTEGVTFTESSLLTPSSDVSVVLNGAAFFFASPSPATSAIRSNKLEEILEMPVGIG